MSKIGKLPVELPKDTTVTLTEGEIVVKGPKGELKRDLPRGFSLEITESEVTVLPPKNPTKAKKAMYGTLRVLLYNMVHGVSEGWFKELELVGTGYRAEVNDSNLKLIVGYSHPIIVEPPEGIAFTVTKSIVRVDGIDKQSVGQVSANIRKARPPEPYKGKGIRYTDEVVRRKAGKAAKAAGAA